MPPSTSTPTAAAEYLDYLIVDEFLQSLIGMRALKSALELGLVTELETGPVAFDDLVTRLQGDQPGVRLLLDLLVAEGVIDESSGNVAMTPRFTRALEYRELMDRKLDFVGFVLLDFVDKFNSLVVDPDRFMREAQVFRLFDYQRSLEPGPENYSWTKVWMRLTTILTRYEAGACLHHYDFSGHQRMLDIGGNSGEFVLRVCRAHPQLRAAVMDLPVVCEFGQDHILPEPELERISFLPGNARQDPIPEGFDLISFKSMLHDWPEEEARRFIERAAGALEPGGTLLIFERGPLDFSDGPPPLAMLPNLMFARFYRPSKLYEEQLAALGFHDIEVRDIELETPFFLVTGRK
jgi:SAM-dependent methyltransferase